MKRLLPVFFVVLAGLLLAASTVRAGIEPYENFIKGKIKRNDTLLVKDEKFRSAKFNWSDITHSEVKDEIDFRITNQVPVSQAFACTLYLKIEYLTDPGQQAPATKNVELKVNFSPKKGAKYKFQDVFNFTGAYWVRVIVENIYSPELGNDLPADFLLTNRIVINRQYRFDPHQLVRPHAQLVKAGTNTAAANTSSATSSLKSRLLASLKSTSRTDAVVNSQTAFLNSNTQLQLTWSTNGPTEYDLEWTTADQNSDYSQTISSMLHSSYGSVDATAIDQIFRHNATRVTIDGNDNYYSYLLSLPYTDAYLLVRTRGVSYSNGIRITGDWDYSRDDNSYAVWSTASWYQGNLNWTYSAAFAEQGKKKEVVNFFDGSLRERQAVTLNNSDQVAVFQEKVYDEFGRPTANILPAPYQEPAGGTAFLRYQPGLNLNAGTPYNSDDVSNTSGSCEISPAPLDNNSGTSGYYSPNNPFMLAGTHLYDKYIPDAEGYPLAVTQYTPDNTGRVKVQGGVGKVFQPGGNGPDKTTKYFYGKPDQWELDQLFGNDVGLASHYFKNMMIDPNGQISISYLNASGKTIATALTGATPQGMSALPSQARSPVVTETNTILNPSDFQFRSADMKITATTTYLASVTGTANLYYNVETMVDHYSAGPVALCTSCYYKMTVRVTDDCGTVQTIANMPVTIGSNATNNCANGTYSNATPTDSQPPIVLHFDKVGEYYITIDLSLDKLTMDNFTDFFVSSGQANGNLQKDFDFVFAQLQTMDFKDCLSDCTTNIQTLGDLNNFSQMLQNKLTELGVDPTSLNRADYQTWVGNEYAALRQYCYDSQQTCSGPTGAGSPCEQYEQVMKEDVSPKGQYALFNADGTPLEIPTNVIYNNWRNNDVFPVKPASDPSYVAEEITLPDGTVTSPYDANFTVALLVQYWKDDWATKFLPYHPEYCKLLFCYQNAAFEYWDQQVQNNNGTVAADGTITQAPGGLVWSDSNPAWLLDADPFFNTASNGTVGPGTSVKAAFRNDLLNYSTNVLKMTTQPNKDIEQFIGYLLYCADPTASTNTINDPNSPNWSNCIPSQDCRARDREWTDYKTFYFQLKQKYYDIIRAQTTCAGKCQIGSPPTLSYTGPCPQATDFAIVPFSAADTAPQPACDPSQYQTLTLVNNRGSVTTQVSVTLTYDGAATPITLTFSPGDAGKSFCLPLKVPAQAVTVQSVACASCQPNPLLFSAWSNDYITQNIYNSQGTIAQTKQLHIDGNSYFSGTLTILPGNSFNVISSLHSYAGSWSQDDSCRFALFGNNNVKYSLYTVNATSLSLGHREGNIEEIWHFTGQGATACSSPATLPATTVQGTNTYLTGSYPARHIITVVPGTAGTTPVFSGTDANGLPQTATSAFYSCLNITLPPNAPVNYQNVWVFDNIWDNQPSTCSANLLTKVSRFPDGNGQVVGNPADPQQGQDQLSQQEQSATTAAAPSWINQLSAGLNGYTAAQIQQLQTNLTLIAQAGFDINHPFGASTTPPGVTVNGLTSFGDAILATIQAAGKGNYFTSTLNPWLIGSPYPYAPKMQNTTETVSNSSAAICTLLAQLQAQCDSYNSANGTNLSLYSYLGQTYGAAMTLSATDFSALQLSCAQCRFIIAHDITLPVFLDPGAKGCVTPTEFQAAETDLQNQFGGNLSTNDPNYEVIFATFMNFRWGFAMTYSQYLDYMNGNMSGTLCNQPPAGTDPDPWECAKEQVATAYENGEAAYDVYIQQKKDQFRASYVQACQTAPATVTLNAGHQLYHYTLYYYDQADNLVRTVPPEGVKLLTSDQLKQVAAARANAANGCTYSGPTSDSDKPTAFQALSNALSAPAAAIEMWFYSSGAGDSQFIEVTPDKKFLFQAVISGNQLGIDIYPLSSSDVNTLTLSPGSIHYRASLAGITLQPFTHIVLQGNNLGASPGAQAYLNGQALTLTTANTTIGPGFTITANNGSFSLPDNITPLKHLRLYSQPLSVATIQANAANSCFMPTDQTYLNNNWFRFNTPAPGGPTTIADNSTDETQIIYTYPAHTLVTTYAYNSTNQVSTQHSPDGGTNRYWYDLLSRLVASQNDKQVNYQQGNPSKNVTAYSYRQYDALGRIIEFGQKDFSTTDGMATGPDYLTDDAVTGFFNTGNNEQITHSYYDRPAPVTPTNNIQTITTQSNLRKRIAASTYQDIANGAVQQASYYDYDIDGNVKTLYQQISGLNELKRMDYNYDLISGKVNFVAYQFNKPDQFLYEYNYDANNRLTEAWSSPAGTFTADGSGSALDQSLGRLDASYKYYLHGPLARMELGDASAKVQGLDYVYTLQGWLKGVNSQDITGSTDVGQDGINGSTIPKDAYGYSLGYYNGDYKAIGGATAQAFISTYAQAPGDPTGQDLFNGNISNSTASIGLLYNGTPKGYSYHYDQLNRLLSVRQHTNLSNWSSGNLTNLYNEDFTYDGNGNILTLSRIGAGQSSTDNLTYQYNRDANGNLTDNKLNNIQGSSTATGLGTQLANNNYVYDQIGNLLTDNTPGKTVTGITWGVNGKIQGLTNTSGNTINYYYDPAGQRAKKTNSGGLIIWYVRDGQGNTMAVYDQNGSQNPITWREQHLYGSNRLGMWTPNLNLSDNSSNASTIWQNIGNKQYELTNQLENVLAVVTDAPASSDGTATVASAQDYYAFGALMSHPDVTSNNTYRYGFNGKENDNDVKGNGDQQDYGMRIYDPRVGRFLSLDPLTKNYPWYTPYQFAGNTPIQAVDMDGLEPVRISAFEFEKPKLKPSQWYEVVLKGGTVLTDDASFDKAARYNITHNNPDAYNSIQLRHEWYSWAARQKKDNYWFSAAADVTSSTMVGGADNINLWFMYDSEEKILRDANKFLLSQNFKNFGQYALGQGPVTWNGKSYGNLTGAALDDQMVVIEMTTLQGFLDSYRLDYIKQHGEDAWNTLHKGLNGLFTSWFLGKFTPESNKYAQSEFEKKFGNVPFDFMNLMHRIFQGQKMAEYLRKHHDKNR